MDDTVFVAKNAKGYSMCAGDSFDDLYDIIKGHAWHMVDDVGFYKDVKLERDDPYVFLTFIKDDKTEEFEYYYMYRLKKGRMN